MKSRFVKLIIKNGEAEKEEIYRVANDINGNPRYVVHFLTIARYRPEAFADVSSHDIGRKYNIAARIASEKIGGRKYRAAWYSGGIVFQSYNLCADLASLLGVNENDIK